MGLGSVPVHGGGGQWTLRPAWAMVLTFHDATEECGDPRAADSRDTAGGKRVDQSARAGARPPPSGLNWLGRAGRGADALPGPGGFAPGAMNVAMRDELKAAVRAVLNGPAAADVANGSAWPIAEVAGPPTSSSALEARGIHWGGPSSVTPSDARALLATATRLQNF